MPICHKKYIRQIGSPFHVRFREHYRDYKCANNKPKFAQHVLEEGHSFGPIKEIMDVLHIAKKCGMLDTLVKFYILRDARRGNPINDKFIVQSSFRGVNSEYHIQGALTPNNIGFHTGHRWKQSP